MALPKKIIEYSIKMLKTVGIWNPSIFCVQFLIMSMAFIVPHFVYIFRSSNGLEDTTESILPSTSALLTIFKYVLLFYKRKDLSSLLQDLQTEWELKVLNVKYQNRDKLVIEANKNSQRISVGYLSLMSIVSLTSMIYPFITITYEKIIGISTGNFTLPFKADYIIDTTKDPAHSIVCCVVIICVIISSIAVSGGDCIFFVTALHIIAHIKSLQRDLRHIGKVQYPAKETIEENTTAAIETFPGNSPNTRNRTQNESTGQNIGNGQQKIEVGNKVKGTERFEEYQEEKLEQESNERNEIIAEICTEDHLTESEAFGQLKQCIARHDQMIGFVEKLENIFSHQSTLQFLSSSLTICLIVFQMTFKMEDSRKIMTFVIYLTGSTLQLYMFAWYGQRLINETSRIGEAAYDCVWYNYSPKFRKSLLLVVLRSQRPSGITASKFYSISVESFAKIINAAASYFTLLKSVKNN